MRLLRDKFAIYAPGRTRGPPPLILAPYPQEAPAILVGPPVVWRVCHRYDPRAMYRPMPTCHVVYVGLMLSEEQRLMELMMVKFDKFSRSLLRRDPEEMNLSRLLNNLSNPCGF